MSESQTLGERIEGALHYLRNGRSQPTMDGGVAQLVQIGPPATPRLVQALRDSTFNRDRIVDALAQICDPEAVAGLAALVDKGSMVAMYALQALSRMGHPTAIPVLVRALDFRDEDTRMYAADGLKRFALEHPHPDLRLAIPVLKRKLAWRYFLSYQRGFYLDALSAIEAATRDLAAVPLPGTPPVPDASSLPRVNNEKG